MFFRELTHKSAPGSNLAQAIGGINPVKQKHLILSFTRSLLFAGCAPTTPESITIRVGVLPVLEPVPMYVAHAERETG